MTPMTLFDKREEGFEREFVHDEELRFKIIARRNRLLGLWAAEKLGLSGTLAEDHTKEVVDAYLAETGEHHVFDKLRKDFNTASVNVLLLRALAQPALLRPVSRQQRQARRFRCPL